LIRAAPRGNVARMVRILVGVVAAVLVGFVGYPTPATAQPAPGPAPIDYFHQGDGGIKVRQERTRTPRQKALIYGLAGGAAVFAGLGLYFHYDSKQIADDISADTPQNQRWSDELADRYDRGKLDRTLAIVSYTVSAGLIAATVVAVLKTDPGTEVRTIGVRAVPGGATVGASWSW
jgi:hypothetical protein